MLEECLCLHRSFGAITKYIISFKRWKTTLGFIQNPADALIVYQFTGGVHTMHSYDTCFLFPDDVVSLMHIVLGYILQYKQE
jgi:hypothetical protein